MRTEYPADRHPSTLHYAAETSSLKFEGKKYTQHAGRDLSLNVCKPWFLETTLSVEGFVR